MDDHFLKPKPLRPGDTIGVFTPSSPAYTANPELFENGIRNLEKIGFKVKLGALTSARATQGYRSASPTERANELMELINDPSVHGVISTIGGYNSSSMIPYLDFTAIRKHQKAFCGYSDVTSLHLAILKYSRLQTYYGPSVMCWFGDWPYGIEESTKWFLDAVRQVEKGVREVLSPKQWSNHMRRWDNGDWKTQSRIWSANPGWRVLREGTVQGEILALNLNTLLTSAGTSYWPDFKNKILMIEDMQAPIAREERSLNQLKLIGVFKEIIGLIFSKPEEYDQQAAPFDLDELLCEIAGADFKYPVVTNFDCGHTVPMITIPQLAKVELSATSTNAKFKFLDS